MKERREETRKRQKSPAARIKKRRKTKRIAKRKVKRKVKNGMKNRMKSGENAAALPENKNTCSARPTARRCGFIS